MRQITKNSNPATKQKQNANIVIDDDREKDTTTSSAVFDECADGDNGIDDSAHEAQEIGSPSKPFGPPKRDKDGKPECFGHYIFGRQCDCPDSWPCQYYTSANKASRSRERHWAGYATVPIIEGMDWECPPECAGTSFDAKRDEEDYFRINAGFPTLDKISGGLISGEGINDDENEEESSLSSRLRREQTSIDPATINIKLMSICLALGIEKPNAAKALLLKLDPNVRSLQDLADIIGITKQGLQRRIATELGIGKRQFKESFLLTLTPREFEIFRLYFRDKLSLRATAKKLKISHQRVLAIVQRLNKRGIYRDNEHGKDGMNVNGSTKRTRRSSSGSGKKNKTFGSSAKNQQAKPMDNSEDIED